MRIVSDHAAVRIRRLLHGFDTTAPAATRWRALAEKKLDEIGALIEQAHRKQRLLESLMSCDCGTLTDCVRPRLVRITPAPATSPATQAVAGA